MSRLLFVPHDVPWRSNKPFGIQDEHGTTVHEARMERGLGWAARIFTAEGEEVAAVRKRWWSWEVELDGEHFEIRRLAFSWSPQYETFGGTWNAASLRGDFLACLPFELEHRGRVLAKASGRLAEGRLHRIELSTEPDEDERFVLAVILMLRLDRELKD